jgi:hypothetical protein
MMAGDLQKMARTNAQKLQDLNAAGNARQAKRRAGMEERGRPETAVVNTAIVEALAFVIAQAVLTAASADARADPLTLTVSVRAIKRVALSVLVDRKGFDREECKIALGQRLSLRDEHMAPSYIPSLRPDPIQQAARAGQAA